MLPGPCSRSSLLGMRESPAASSSPQPAALEVLHRRWRHAGLGSDDGDKGSWTPHRSWAIHRPVPGGKLRAASVVEDCDCSRSDIRWCRLRSRLHASGLVLLTCAALWTLDAPTCTALAAISRESLLTPSGNSTGGRYRIAARPSQLALPLLRLGLQHGKHLGADGGALY